MSSYRKGRAAENYIKRRLNSMGFFTIRCAGSKPIDLISFKNNLVFGIEVKAMPLTLARADRFFKQLKEIIEGTVMIPMLLYLHDGYWIFMTEM